MVTFFQHFVGELIVIEIRPESQGNTIIGDFRQEVQPGESWMGYSYDDLRALGEGRHTLLTKTEA